MAALFAADRPLGRDELLELFAPGDGRVPPGAQEIEAALESLAKRLATLPLELKKLASGYRLEVPANYARWINRLWVERPARYSRALLETLALIAYRQPITRPEIESVRGVAVSTHIVRTLEERGWIRVVGHRDAPGKPALYATTRTFLDYFGLASLDELPTLAEIRDLSEFEPELPLGEGEEAGAGAARASGPEKAWKNEAGAEPPGEVLAGPWVGNEASMRDGPGRPAGSAAGESDGPPSAPQRPSAAGDSRARSDSDSDTRKDD